MENREGRTTQEQWAWEDCNFLDYDIVECKYCGEIYGEDERTSNKEFPCPYCEVEDE